MGEGRFAKKGLLDPLKPSGGSPRQSWGLEQWFSSTPRRTSPVDDMEEESKDEKLPLAAVDMTVSPHPQCGYSNRLLAAAPIPVFPGSPLVLAVKEGSAASYGSWLCLFPSLLLLPPSLGRARPLSFSYLVFFLASPHDGVSAFRLSWRLQYLHQLPAAHTCF